MKISYAITCCTELEELSILIPFLIKNKQEEDEIVVLCDQTKNDEELIKFSKYLYEKLFMIEFEKEYFVMA
jgi:hypothetical protein